MRKTVIRIVITMLALTSLQKAQGAEALPKLIDLGADKCIPCKEMAPILEKMKTDFAGVLDVQFIDVWKNPEAGEAYDIELIPTQIFFDAEGKELFRHVGFFGREEMLAKWRELGYDFKPATAEPKPIERWKPAEADTRPGDMVCDFCDGDVDPNDRVIVTTDKGDMIVCSPHCYFIMYSCLTQDKTGFEENVAFTDAATGKPVTATSAVFLYGTDEETGRPTIHAYASEKAASTAKSASGGTILDLSTLRKKELAHRCGFCDRAVYPEDAAMVKAGGIHTWGCCAHCSLGVAARTGLDIEVHQPDALTGEIIIIKTMNGSVASIEPETAVAWFGMRQKPDNSWGSAGCFHQGNFTSVENLRKWLEAHPLETGKQITIEQALADKMKLTPEQISKACKLGECAPK
jgi:thioredoxin 1